MDRSHGKREHLVACVSVMLLVYFALLCVLALWESLVCIEGGVWLICAYEQLYKCEAMHIFECVCCLLHISLFWVLYGCIFFNGFCPITVWVCVLGWCEVFVCMVGVREWDVLHRL